MTTATKVEKQGKETSMEGINKPIVQLSGEDGNIFSIVGRCRRALKLAGQSKQADEMSKKVTAVKSYDEALQIVMSYVDTR